MEESQRLLVAVRCGTFRRQLGHVVLLPDGRAGVLISDDAAEGAQWLVDAGRCTRHGTAFVVPDQGVVPLAPCPQHTQWRSGPGLRRGGARNVREAAERIKATVTVHRTAYVSASIVAKPILQARSTGRSATLLIKPGHYNDV